MTLDPKVREALERCDRALEHCTRIGAAPGLTIHMSDYDLIRAALAVKGDAVAWRAAYDALHAAHPRVAASECRMEEAPRPRPPGPPAPPMSCHLPIGHDGPHVGFFTKRPLTEPLVQGERFDTCGTCRTRYPCKALIAAGQNAPPPAPTTSLFATYAEDAEVSKVLRDNLVAIATDAPPSDETNALIGPCPTCGGFPYCWPHAPSPEKAKGGEDDPPGQRHPTGSPERLAFLRRLIADTRELVAKHEEVFHGETYLNAEFATYRMLANVAEQHARFIEQQAQEIARLRGERDEALSSAALAEQVRDVAISTVQFQRDFAKANGLALRDDGTIVNERAESLHRRLAEKERQIEALDLALSKARQDAARGAQDTTGHHCEARKKCIAIRDSIEAALSEGGRG